MPIVTQTLFIELIKKCMLHNCCTFNIVFVIQHRCPLERCKWLRYKERRACCNLALAISLILWNLIISSSNLICQNSDCLHIFLCLCRKPQHEVKLYFVPSAFKCLSGSGNDILFRQTFINDITHPLGTSLRCKCQTALTDILHLAHYIQRKCINTKRRQRYIDPLILKVIDQECHQFLQFTVITGT